MSDSAIEQVSDTAYLAAHLRAVESARPDALFSDPLAARLAGEHGRRIAESAPNPMSAWQIAMRTRVIDRLLRRAIADGVDAFLNLGAGLDTRPYRLDVPATLRWIEVDYPHVQQFKSTQLAGETPRCRVERVSLDLTDPAARRALFARINVEAKRVLVLTEGVVPYLSVEDAGALADDLCNLHAAVGWIVDYVAPEIVRYRRTAKIDAANAPFLFEPPDWHAFFAAHGWRQREIRYLAEEAAECNRPPLLPPQVAQSEGFRKSMGYVLLERER
ncbi:MAG: class I SAM-dependent methyltransferase [Deltaproteobacteria bacterium]|nr:class I SAM-dependent methyltransferase [Deltaproteobacteria bacterium]